MKSKKVDNAKVGLLVLSGLIFLILTLYMIGKNRNLFGSTFTIKALLGNVNGLVPGNNVRFKGIDVGTVVSIDITNDTSILVTMLIDKKIKPYIKKNAIASIGTDGLMGNKLVNINSSAAPGDNVEQDDVIHSLPPVETDEMLRTLNTTNKNVEKISENLYKITEKLHHSESFWTILSDTSVARDIKKALGDFRRAGEHTADLTASGRKIVTRLENGNGLAFQIFDDTLLANRLSVSLDQLQKASSETFIIMNDLKATVAALKQGEGTAGLLLTDTVLRKHLLKSGANLEEGTDRFNQNMEALKSNFLFRKYFRKQEKNK